MGRALPLAATLLLATCTASAPAFAAGRLCGDRDQIISRLAERHHETPRAIGLSSDGGVLEVLVSPEGTWTIIVSYPNRPTCVVGVGEAWEETIPGTDS